MGLVARTVTLTGSFKSWGIREGISTGSEMAVTYEVPSDMSDKELKEELVRKKFALDMQTLKFEYARGFISSDMFAEFEKMLRERMSLLLRAQGGEDAKQKPPAG